MISGFELKNNLEEAEVHHISSAFHNLSTDNLIKLKTLLKLELDERRLKE